jgi:lipopolysaccharide export system ATP-binding protein
MALLAVSNLSHHVGKKEILKAISFVAEKGNVIALLGPNGAGKTTLLKSIMGLNGNHKAQQEPDHNVIMFESQLINEWSIGKRVERGLLYLPQHTSLFQSLTVQQNLDVVYHYHPYWQQQTRTIFETESHQWLNIANLSHAKAQTAGSLSGGQKRKLEVVRSLLMKPKMVMLDEPFAGVDPKSIYELKHIFQQLAQSGIGVVISDHNVDQLLSIAQTVYVIVGGSVVTSGSIKDVLENKYTKESYLGAQFYQEIAQRYLQ